MPIPSHGSSSWLEVFLEFGCSCSWRNSSKHHTAFSPGSWNNTNSPCAIGRKESRRYFLKSDALFFPCHCVVLLFWNRSLLKHWTNSHRTAEVSLIRWRCSSHYFLWGRHTSEKAAALFGGLGLAVIPSSPGAHSDLFSGCLVFMESLICPCGMAQMAMYCHFHMQSVSENCRSLSHPWAFLLIFIFSSVILLALPFTFPQSQSAPPRRNFSQEEAGA